MYVKKRDWVDEFFLWDDLRNGGCPFGCLDAMMEGLAWVVSKEYVRFGGQMGQSEGTGTGVRQGNLAGTSAAAAELWRRAIKRKQAGLARAMQEAARSVRNERQAQTRQRRVPNQEPESPDLLSWAASESARCACNATAPGPARLGLANC
ncbi:hypothetical protein AB5N19_14238 [Seiridium cardinale]